MRNWLQDLRRAARNLRKTPGFTAVTVLTLTVGIGANSAIFSVVNGVLLRPLPYPGADRIVRIWSVFARRDMPPLGAGEGEFLDYQRECRAFSDLGVFVAASANLTGGGDPERLPVAYTSAGFFSVLGVKPMIGTVYGPAEDKPKGPAVAVLSHALWQRRFAAEPQIVGRTVVLNNRATLVLGVMPASFELPPKTDLWMPLQIDPNDLAARELHYLGFIARLKPGLSVAQASSDINTVARRFTERDPIEYPADSGWGVRLVPLVDEVVGDTRPALLILLGAVGLVLLIACANVANLLLARAQVRGKEISIRVVLGARRRDLVRASLAEGLLLSLAGGALGLLLANLGLAALLAANPDPVPRAGEITLDWRVAAWTAGLALATGLILGLVPVIRALRPDLQSELKEGGGKATVGTAQQRFRRAVVGLEMALTVVLLIGAGLMIRSFLRLRGIDMGFPAERLLTMQISLTRAQAPGDAQVAQAFDRMVGHLAALPGIQQASAVNYLPLSGGQNTSETIGFEGQVFTEGEPLPEPDYRAIDYRYFRTLGIKPLAGREFRAGDTAGAPLVVVLDKDLARRLFPGRDPIGRRVKVGPPHNNNPHPWLTVVGVVPEVKQLSLTANPRGVIYYPQLQRPIRGQFLVLRTQAANPLAMAGPVRRAILALNRDQPVSDVKSMVDRIAGARSKPRFSMTLFSIFAAVAALLALVGIYGVVAYAVAQRTHELGVRMVLGASRGSVFRMVVAQGMAVALAGLGAGLLAAFWATRALSSLLYGVATRDAATFVAVPLMLTAVALLAIVVPVRRAVRLDPNTALRYE
jgi:predicted permease